MTDDELRARIRAADPAADLPPADQARAHRLVADVMSTELTSENRQTGTRGRSPLTWAVAAVAVVVIGAGAAFALLSRQDQPSDTPAAVADRTVTELRAPAGEQAARCMVPNAEVLGRA